MRSAHIILAVIVVLAQSILFILMGSLQVWILKLWVKLVRLLRILDQLVFDINTVLD